MKNMILLDCNIILRVFLHQREKILCKTGLNLKNQGKYYMNITGYILLIIILSISFLHIYWALGGTWGKDLAVPTTENEIPLFEPGAFVCLITGFCFLLPASAIVFPSRFSLPILWINTFLFFIRAVGDFRYIGFFKKIKNTPFSQRDTLIYTPLCVLISFLTLLLINTF
ncbi:DUF3995 domain-containing protein [Chryseobacterium lathyri]|uniref:DUF3995 domain-containing protein n=2 Tax=Chryseobacterium lathyri TaxID=395933 RepID=UPI003590073C